MRFSLLNLRWLLQTFFENKSTFPKEAENKPSSKDCGLNADALANKSNTHQFGNIYLGSPNKATSFDLIEQEHYNDPAFHNFCNYSLHIVTELLQRDDSPVKLKEPQTFVSQLRSLSYVKIASLSLEEITLTISHNP